MSTSSDESAVEAKKASPPLSDSDSDSNNKRARATKNNKTTIEDGDTSESFSDGEEKSPKKRRYTKKAALKRKRGDDSDDDTVDTTLFENETDLKRWKGLSELDKEKEIFNRMEAREAQRTREEIEEKLKQRKERETKKTDKKRKVETDSDRSPSPIRRQQGGDSSDDMDAEFHRPSDINRKNKEKNALDALKHKRRENEKKQAKAALSIDAIFGANAGSSSSSSSSASSRSSSRSSSPSSPARIVVEEKIVKKEVETLEELQKARLSRFKLSKLCHAPFFNDTVIGCYVRIGLGQMSGSDSKYKLWQIYGVEETNKVYEIEGKRTNKGIKCKHGKMEKVFRMQFVSNSDWMRAEFDEWLAATKQVGSVPTVDAVEKKEADIKKAMNHRFSDAEVDLLIKEKGRFSKVPQNFAMTKAELSKKKELAQQRGDIREAESFQQKIDEIERHADDLDKKRTAKISGIALINYRNRNQIKNQVLNGEFKMETVAEDDPFTRKKGGMRVVSGSKTRIDGTVSASSSTLNVSALAQEVAKSTSIAVATTAPKPAAPSELYNLHNFELNIDLQRIGANLIPDQNLAQKRPAPPSKGLSLDDYRRRRAEAAAANTSTNSDVQ